MSFKKFRYPIVVIAITLFLHGCRNSHENAALDQVTMNPQDIVLFYLDSLQHHNMTKIVTVNGKSDTFIVKQADWIKEMDFLEAINTNKPAYKGTLKLDTTRIADTLVYHLKCLDQKLNLKEAFIYYHKDQLLHMSLTSFGSNFLFKNAKEIYFNPTKGYRIHGFQQLDLISKQNMAYIIQVNKTL
jgi:hypothetical protein